MSDGREEVLYYGERFTDHTVDDCSEYYQLPFNHRADIVTPPEWAQDELLFTHEIPHIVIGNPNFNSHFCWLDIDNRLAGELAAKHLLERGCQSVAFIGGKPDDHADPGE